MFSVRSMIAMTALFLLTIPMIAQDPAQPASKGYRVLGSDAGRKTVSIINAKGEVEWQVPTTAPEIHDIAMLPNGNILFPTKNRYTLVEMTPDKKVVWEYTAKQKEGYKGAIEIHGFQRLANGLTLVGEGGNSRLVEVDKEGKVVHVIPLTVDKSSAHRDTRRVRSTPQGTYLVCHEGDGKVREYDRDGKVIWTYALDLNNRPRTGGHDGHGTEVFGAIRLPNGNTMIAGGNNNRVIEVTKEGKVVWSVEHDELPGIKFAWVTTIEVLPNGNLILGHAHAGPNNPQMFEVTRDKKVLWKLQDFKVFGNDLCATQILDVPGTIR